VSFDRVASIYDVTRALPAGVVERLVSRVVAATRAGPHTQFLEIGVGTGRIATPFVERGYDYTGVDISRQMMQQLKAKASHAGNLRLIEADVTELPFPDGSFDVVLTVHVLHLVPEWKRALQEVRRVLREMGYFVQAHDASVPGTAGDEIRRTWRQLVEAAGVSLRSEYGSWQAVDTELTAQGCRTAHYRVARWSQEFRPIDFLEGQRSRTYSMSWEVPDDVLISVHERMLSWARQQYGDVRRSLSSEYECFVSVSRFPS
jgi:ubiquinone/menaquinone biosynthesis C-methylase UbiE